jgi:3',5'-cyclic AMP phosphodiesterase CpdA
MNRRDFLKWVTAATITSASVLFGIPEVVLSPIKQVLPVTKRPVMARDKGIHIAVLSDLHIQDPQRSKEAVHYNGKAKQAIEDVLSLYPDRIVIVGDIVHHGFQSEYQEANRLFQSIRNKGIPLYVSMGNHEYYDTKKSNEQARMLFLQEFGLIQPYQSIVKDDVHLVLLSTEGLEGSGHSRDWARIGNEQLDWFASVLQQHQEKTTLVFLHQPLNDTVEQSQYQDWIARTAQTDKLLAIASRHPQIKCWFSGHTHAPLQNRNQIVYRHGIWFVGGASTFYTNDIQPATEAQTGPTLGQRFKKKLDFQASQSRFVSVYQDKILIQARDHQKRQWIKELEHTIPI